MNLTAKNETAVYTITGLTSFPILTTFLDYLPYMVFTNMFAIFYLETICMTKKTAKKTEDDQKIGHYINGFISLFFLFIFVLLCVLSNTTY
jgi:preprotein translocase subunit SecY